MDTRRRIRPSTLLLWSTFVFGCALATYARYTNINRPGVAFADGFYGWSDQRFYLRTAEVLSQLRLPSSVGEYMYGLGYPALGSVFLRLGFEGDAFAPVDVLAFGAILVLTVVLGTRLRSAGFGDGAWVVGVAAALVVAFGTPMLGLVSAPWNTTPTTVCLLAVLVIVTRDGELRRWHCVALGACIGWAFATRYVDAIWVAVPVVAAFSVRRPRERRRILVAGGAAAALLVVFVLATHHHAFGDWLATPYRFHTRAGAGNDQSIDNYRLSNIGEHLLGAFVTGRSNGVRQPGSPLLLEFPLLVLAPFGAWVVCTRLRDRAVWISTAVASLVATLFYASFEAAGAADLKFYNLRYWAMWYPVWSFFAVAVPAFVFHRWRASRSDAGRGDAAEQALVAFEHDGPGVFALDVLPPTRAHGGGELGPLEQEVDRDLELRET
jgi:hypothetical protein